MIYICTYILFRACYHVRKDMEENRYSNASEKMNEVNMLNIIFE